MKTQLPMRHWVLWLFPELSLFDTPEQQYKAYRESVKWKFANLRFGGWFLLFVLAISVVEWFLRPLIGGYFRNPDTLDDLFLYGRSLLFVAAALYGPYLASRRQIRRSLRQQLADLGIPVCDNCGYNLRGQGDACCSECGTPFERGDELGAERQDE